jgi:CRP/FNR family transcriptional regulator
VPKSSLEALVERNPVLQQRILRQALRELDEAREWMVTLGRKTAAERVASFLHLIAEHAQAPHGRSGPTSFDLPLSRGDIADFLGLTIETVSRQMTKLRQEGVIRIVNLRHIEVADLARLRRRCG